MHSYTCYGRTAVHLNLNLGHIEYKGTKFSTAVRTDGDWPLPTRDRDPELFMDDSQRTVRTKFSTFTMYGRTVPSSLGLEDPLLNLVAFTAVGS